MLMSFRFTTGTRNPPPPSECFAALDRCIASGTPLLPKAVLPKSEMSSVLVVITDVLIQQPSQMSPIQHDHMIQEISTYTANPALRNSVLPRTAECGSNRLAAHRLHGRDDIGAELRVAIEDQEALRLLECGSHPGVRRLPELFVVMQHKSSSQVCIRRMFGLGSHCIRLMGIFKPDCVFALQRKGRKACLLGPVGHFLRVRFRRERCGIAGIFGDFQGKAVGFLCT